MNHVLLKNGEIMAQGKKEEILTKTILEKFYNHPITLHTIDKGRYFIQPK